MSKNDRTYQHEDVMQAIVSALLFGEKAGLAAIAEYDEEPDEKVVEIHPEAGSILHVTAAAAGMLAEAQAVMFDAFGKGEEPEGEAVDIDMSEVTPGNTEQVYRDQPIPERGE